MRKATQTPEAAPAGRLPLPPKLRERVIAIRRELHRHPEPSWEERETAWRIEGCLDHLGLRHRRICDTGVIAEVPGETDGPRIALRADIDALPIVEETGLPFASQNPGVMHACGHDGHAAMLLGAGELLAGEPPPGPVRLIFQPAEEVGAGAKRLIEGGVLEGVAAIFGGHLDIHHPAGRIFVTPGTVAASTDNFRIRLVGRGGHAGRPHEAVDAVLAASHLVIALQHVVAREVAPTEAAVVTVGIVRAGDAANAIAGTAELLGTVRAFRPEVRELLVGEVRRIADETARLHRASADVRIEDGTPPVVNDRRATEIAQEAAVRVAGENVQELPSIHMAGEDFSYYQERLPGCYVRFGARPRTGEPHPNHSSRFDFDEEAIGWGAAWFAEVARTAGRRLRGGSP